MAWATVAARQRWVAVMGCFSFTAAITPAAEAEPSGRRLLAKLQDLQSAIPAAKGRSREQIDAALAALRHW